MLHGMTIFYVNDPDRAKKFYRAILHREPTLDVPGMCEFPLAEDYLLGLMPDASMKRLLGSHLPDTASSASLRAELYLFCDDPAADYALACSLGATPLSPLQLRDWGDEVAYVLDPDGYVVGLAKRK